jgi:hypothetical protein
MMEMDVFYFLKMDDEKPMTFRAIDHYSTKTILYIWMCLKMLCTPFYPMVLLIIIPFLNGYFIGNIPNIFRQTQMDLRNETRDPKIAGEMMTARILATPFGMDKLKISNETSNEA